MNHFDSLHYHPQMKEEKGILKGAVYLDKGSKIMVVDHHWMMMRRRRRIDWLLLAWLTWLIVRIRNYFGIRVLFLNWGKLISVTYDLGLFYRVSEDLIVFNARWLVQLISRYLLAIFSHLRCFADWPSSADWPSICRRVIFEVGVILHVRYGQWFGLIFLTTIE